VKQFGMFLWDFVVGDDWVGAAGVALLLGMAATLAHLAHVGAWWLLPPGVSLVLAATLRRAVRAAAPTAGTAAPSPVHYRPTGTGS
jgi:hypothetical protein